MEWSSDAGNASVSAGNLDVDACHVSPGNSQGTIDGGASAATREVSQDGRIQMIDRRSRGTAYDSCIDVYAPGDSVLPPSLDREFAPISQLWNGTSMAAGCVSGAAALFLETHPMATPAARIDRARQRKRSKESLCWEQSSRDRDSLSLIAPGFRRLALLERSLRRML
ncbi:MAG TPA: S8 family serine peptidase [Gemmatimonadaceae bacterium]